MNFSMGSGIIDNLHKSFKDIFEVPCTSKFRAFRSSACFEVQCASKFRAFRSSMRSPYLTEEIRGVKSPGVKGGGKKSEGGVKSRETQ